MVPRVRDWVAVLAFANAGFLACVRILASASSTDAAESVQVEARVGVDSVTVGERLHIRYTAAYPESLTFLPLQQFDPGNCRFVSVAWREVAGNGDRMKEADVVVLPMDLESAHVPPAPFFFLRPGGDTLVAYANEVDVPIRALTADTSEARPLKPQWQAPRDYWRYIIIGGIALLVAAAAFLLWRRLRRPKPVVEVTRPELPADYVALKALGEIERMRLLEAGEFKKYYTLVVDVLRHYLERRYGILAMDRTTDEILRDLFERRVPMNGCEGLLREADLVKFAKFKPNVADGQRAMETAKDLVARTTPRPVAATTGDN
jgi:hypothetical protein